MNTGLPRSWKIRIGAIVLVAIVLLIAFRFVQVLRTDWATSAATIAVVIGALGLLAVTISDHGLRLQPARWNVPPIDETAVPSGLDPQLLRLNRDLRDAVERRDRPDTVHLHLRALTRERLLAAHDIDLDTDPDAARDLLHPELRSYLDQPPRASERRSAKDIARALTRIEEIT